MKITDYDYRLDSRLIASQPPKTRGTSRLLVLNKASGQLTDDYYRHIADWLEAGDVLVLNQTKVIKARLQAVKANGAKRELIILEKHGRQDNWHRHGVLYRGKLRAGEKLKVGRFSLTVTKIIGDGQAVVQSRQDILDLADRYGNVPLPPYFHRAANSNDVKRYQTVWAKNVGSVAAPTASLNMTTEILKRIQLKGVKIVHLTLHVGLGTFMPIRSANVENHKMHQEYYDIPATTVTAIRTARKNGHQVVALGTTVCRSLEYCAAEISARPAHRLSGEADIFIYPGYQFKIVDCLITNFHTPRSTVLMMAAAFSGWQNLKTAYQHAMAENYHMLSYGDSMLIR